MKKAVITIEKTHTFRADSRAAFLNDIYIYILFKLRDNVQINSFKNSDIVDRKTEKYLKKISKVLFENLKMKKASIPNLSDTTNRISFLIDNDESKSNNLKIRNYSCLSIIGNPMEVSINFRTRPLLLLDRFETRLLLTFLDDKDKKNVDIKNSFFLELGGSIYISSFYEV